MSDGSSELKTPASEEQTSSSHSSKSSNRRKRARKSNGKKKELNGTAPAVEMTNLDSSPLSEQIEAVSDCSDADKKAEMEEEAEEEEQKKWHWTARVPGQILPTVVGPVGMGLCWKKMSIVWGDNYTLHIISLVILGWTVFQMTILFGLMVYRYIRYPDISLLEQKHPTHFIFGILTTLYFCLISSFIINWNTKVAEVFWYIGFGAMSLYMLYTGHRTIVQKIPVAQLNAFHLFGPLPILLATQLAPFAPKELLFYGWSTGTIWYFGLHVLLVFRWSHVGLPAKRDRAAMWLLLAASADSVLSYAAASEYGFGEVAKCIFFFSIFQFGVLLTLSQRIFYSGFVPTWWMTTLPCTAFSSSWISYGVALNNRNIIIFGTTLVACSTLWILTLYLLTAIWFIRREFWPKSPYRPPIDTTTLV